MNYELLKEIKEAGFKVTTLAEADAEKVYLYDGNGGGYRKPSLSELIAACGEKFTVLERRVGNPFNYSSTPDATVWWAAPLGPIVNEGSTPEEAVSRLYLELNKKP